VRRRAKADRLRALEGEVESLRAAIGLLHRISHLVVTALELEPTCYAVLTGVTAGVGLGLNRAMIFLVEGETRLLHGAGAAGPADEAEAEEWRMGEADAPELETLYESGLRRRVSPGRLDQKVREMTLDPQGDTPVALSLRRGQLVIGEGSDDAGGLFHRPTAMAVPLRDRHVTSGVLYADNRFTGKKLDHISRMVFTMVAEDAGRAIENAQRFEKVAGEARTDALTGLGHHGSFMVDLGREVAAALAGRRPLGLCMVDLDGFKRVNDNLGHLAGDALLIGLAARMRGVIRGGKGLYRFGGDEFAILLPGADRASAAAVGQRLRRAVSEQPFALGDGQKIPITCSIGVASIVQDAVEPRALIAAADAALLYAKARGKNRVMEAEPPA
jgi:diguanylate cyclase (GGDEF)-like protein